MDFTFEYCHFEISYFFLFFFSLFFFGIFFGLYVFWVTHNLLIYNFIDLFVGYSIVKHTYQIYLWLICQNLFKTYIQRLHNPFINPPLVRTSTMVFKSMSDLRKVQRKI